MTTIITTDDRKDSPPPRTWGLAKALVCLCVVALTAIAVYVYGPSIRARLVPTVQATEQPIIIATTQPTARAIPTRMPVVDAQPAAAPVQQSIDNYNATAQAQFEAAQPVPNTGHTGEVAPVFSKPAERLPAGDNVPTALPIEPAQSDSGHGSKTIPANVQETKTCLHGQVWVEDKGCRNP